MARNKIRKAVRERVDKGVSRIQIKCNDGVVCNTTAYPYDKEGKLKPNFIVNW